MNSAGRILRASVLALIGATALFCLAIIASAAAYVLGWAESSGGSVAPLNRKLR